MSDSESDSEGEKIRRRTKRKVVVKFEFDDSQSSQQSDSDAMQPARGSHRQRRQRRKLSSSDEDAEEMEPQVSNVRPRRNDSGTTTAHTSQTFYDDDESSDSSWCPETAGPSSRPNARNMPNTVTPQCEIEPDKDEQSDTSSDDASNEKCPICLHSFREQEVGMPNICEHSFCAPCIEEWSKNVQTCPIDRKAFSYIIVRDRYENGKIVREIKVVAQSTVLSMDDDDNDVTLCEICSHGDREDRMLLCDDCNLGYHMDCLNPPLVEVPTGSWYCDNCFASEQSSGEDDIHQLIEELETEIGIPETRLRVRRVDDQPRITRTRQSERIRASIISRIAPSRRHASVNQEESSLGMILPGPSRITTTTTTTTTTMSTSRTARRLTGRRKKRRKRKRRTYVVEYDVNNFDEKFSIKTTKKVVKRRRRRTATKPKMRTLKSRRVAGARCRRSTNLMGSNIEAASQCSTKSGIQKPIDGGYPKLHLFGDKNALEYFSDDNESGNEFEEHSGHGLSGAGGGSLLATALTRTRIGGNSSLRRRKRIVSALDANPASAGSIDILSSIMDTMDRLNPVVRPNESVKKDDDFTKKIVKPDGKQPEADDTTNSDVLHAPMYPGGGSSGGYNNNRFQNNDQSFRSSSRNSGGSSNNTSNTSNSGSSSSSAGSGTSMSFSIFGPRPTFPASGPVGNSCGNPGLTPNNFPSRFPTTPPNRTPRPQFRPRTPFNQTPSPQRFSPRNFNSRFLRPNESPNIDGPQQQQQQGLYDDVEMPPNSQDIRVPNSQPPPQTPSLLDMRITNPNSNIPDMRTPPQHPPPQQSDFQLNHRMSAPPPHLTSPMNLQHHHHNPMARPPMQQQTFVNTMHELPPPQSTRMQHLPPPSRPSMTLGSPMCMQTPPPPVPPMLLHTPTHIMPPPIIPQMPFANSHMFGADVQNPIQVLGCMPPPKAFNANQSFNNFNQNNEKQNDPRTDTDENICQSNLIPIAAEDIPLPVGTTSQNSTLRGLAEYSGSDDEDDCPNLLVYSAESLNMVKQPDSMDEPLVFGPINRPCNEHEMERDEDLVQMDDDDDDDEEEAEEEEEQRDDGTAEKRTSQNEDKDESKAATSSGGKKNVLELYDDSDWEEYNVKNDEDKTRADSNDKIEDGAENNNAEQADERSYTPCLDEQFQLSGEGDKIKETNEDFDDDGDDDDDDKSSMAGDDDKDKNDENGSQRRNSMSGIGGMETELISDDDDEDILSKGQNGADEEAKGGPNRNGKKAADKKRDTKSNDDGKEKSRRKKDDSFKKISRSNKDRNYRDKKFDTKRRTRRNRSRSRSRSRSRTRSRSNNKENRRFYKRDKFRRRDIKRKDIERYDVRHIIAERQPRTFKDKYGRDTSRPPRSRSASLTRTRKRTKSPSRTRRSRSIQSISPRRRTPSPRRRSLSRVRSISRGRRRSLSRPVRRISHTPPPSLRRRSRTPVRSRSRSRPLNGRQMRSNSLSPRQFNRPVSRQPSPSPIRGKVRSKNRRKDGEKKAVKRKMKKRLKCPEPTKKAATMTANPLIRSRSKSWENANRLSPWSRSPTPLRIDEPNNDHSWTPPIVAAETENLTVILKNKDAKRKKEKKKRTEKRREVQQKRERRKLRNEKPAPSKEVFASGDNILVSVSFNKEANKAQQTTIVTLPPTKEQILPKKPTERETVTKRSKRGPRKHKKITAKPVAIIDLDRSPFKEITPSPKAVIVLSDSDHEDNNNTDKQDRPTVPVSDNEVTSSNMGSRCMDAQSEQISQPQSPTMDDLSFENATLGPKTPPEPSSIVKFSLPIKMKNKLRVVNNPLHEIHDDETASDQQNEESTLNASDSSQQQNKVGPNTPPESACSPDAYDPFEPTKSPSQSPDNRSDNCDSSPNDRDDSHTNKSDISTTQEDKLQQQQQQQQQQEKSVKPVDLTIALINSKASMDAAHSLLSSTLEGGVNESEIIDDDDDVQILSPNDESDDIPKPQTINVISNVILSHPKDSMRQRAGGLALPSFSSSAISPAKTNASSSTPKQSPMKPKFSSASLITKLPLPKPSKPIAAANRHNGGNDENMDIDPSPYSPDSSDYDDLFEPPNISPPPSHQKKGKAGKAAGGKTEIFEDLFGSTSPVTNKLAGGGRGKKQRSKKSSIKEWLSENKKTGSAFSKMTDDQIRILDDLPSSAVDLQVKDKFLRKIHRQERVVEEVKLVLKPHYNKKHISKDDYKEILRRAVPKICHNRTGEINPKKIHALIEAYVKKFRHRRKSTSTNVK